MTLEVVRFGDTWRAGGIMIRGVCGIRIDRAYNFRLLSLSLMSPSLQEENGKRGRFYGEADLCASGRLVVSSHRPWWPPFSASNKQQHQPSISCCCFVRYSCFVKLHLFFIGFYNEKETTLTNKLPNNTGTRRGYIQQSGSYVAYDFLFLFQNLFSSSLSVSWRLSREQTTESCLLVFPGLFLTKLVQSTFFGFVVFNRTQSSQLCCLYHTTKCIHKTLLLK